MKKLILSGIVLAFVFISCNSSDNKAKDTKPAEASTMDTTTKQAIVNPADDQLFACSMHPEVKGKKDEKCSKCGMKITEPIKK